MSEKKESRFSRVVEGIYRYKSGGFYLRRRLAGKPVWHKLKNSDLQSARREAQDIIRTGFYVQRKQVARTLENFSQQELDRYSNAADNTRKKVEAYHEEVVDHWPGGAGMPVASAGKHDVEIRHQKHIVLTHRHRPPRVR
jgi:hypothetical protein